MKGEVTYGIRQGKKFARSCGASGFASEEKRDPAQPFVDNATVQPTSCFRFVRAATPN
jgi:hypothetical protein